MIELDDALALIDTLRRFQRADSMLARPRVGEEDDVALADEYLSALQEHQALVRRLTQPPRPQKISFGRVVWYRSRTGAYDLPAMVNCTVDSIDPRGVELGHVPALSSPDHVHLTVFTAGIPGTAREGNEVNTTQVAGTYQEHDIPAWKDDDGDIPLPGSWRWPVFS